MATKIEIQDFRDQLARGVHNFGSHTFRIACSNTAITVGMTMLSEITAISLANITGGVNPAVTVTAVEAAGTMTISGNAVTLTASGGAVPTFRYYALYNDTATSPVDALVLAWDHGSAVTLALNETFKISFNSTDVAGTILTIA
jgi:hypothetical protein